MNHHPRGLPSKDWCDEHNAHELARRVRDYWAERGYTIKTAVISTTDEGQGGVPTPRPVFSVRSNMLDGWPQGADERVHFQTGRVSSKRGKKSDRTMSNLMVRA